MDSRTQNTGYIRNYSIKNFIALYQECILDWSGRDALPAKQEYTHRAWARENGLFCKLELSRKLKNYQHSYPSLRAAIRTLKIRTDARRSNPQIYQLQRLLHHFDVTSKIKRSIRGSQRRSSVFCLCNWRFLQRGIYNLRWLVSHCPFLRGFEMHSYISKKGITACERISNLLKVGNPYTYLFYAKIVIILTNNL